jgi:hypothetical protein
MTLHRIRLLIVLLLGAQLLFGCALFDRKNEDLPEKRKVKTVVFPVRHFKYNAIDCRQEYEEVDLSGSMTNVSPYTLSNVRVYTKIFFAGNASTRMLILATDPPTILPGEEASFHFTETVEDPVASVEIHTLVDRQ